MAEKTKLWYLENFNLFSEMPSKSMEEMDRFSNMKANKKKEIIYFPDEASKTIYILKEGKVKISRISEDGRTTTLQLIGPGEIFGEGALLGQENHQEIADITATARQIVNMGPDMPGKGMEFQVLIIAVSLLFAFKGNRLNEANS